MVKRLSTMWETRVRSLVWEDPLEKEMAIHSRTIAWKIPWTEEPGGLQSMGSQRVGHDWATSLHFTSNDTREDSTHGHHQWSTPKSDWLYSSQPKMEKLYQFSSVTQSCPTLCDPMNHSTPGLPVHHQLPKFTQTHVHRVGDAFQPSRPLSSPF